MRFTHHLRELRARILRLLALFAVWTTIFLTFRFETRQAYRLAFAVPVADVFDNAAARAYESLARALVPPGVDLIVTRPTEAVAAQLQVAFLLGFVLVLPALLFELWAFFTPALREREARALGRTLPVALVLFLSGATFAYYTIVPFMFRAFYAFADPLGARAFLSAGSLVGTVVAFALVFGLAFELPLTLVLLVRLGVVDPHAYVRHWRGVTFGIFVLAAVVTDPTLVSQLLVGAILLGLYWAGVGASFLARPAASAPANSRAAAQ
jgi:sec-independent protein translocase protein TatC